MLNALSNAAGFREPLGMETATLGDTVTILAVDDDHDLLRLLGDILTGQGYRVNVADSGEKALTSVAASPPDLILLDIMMPGLNGFDVLSCLKDHDASYDVPIVFLSAHDGTTKRVKGLQLGAMDFIAKPFEAEELLARVQTHLRAHRLRVRAEQQRDELCSALTQVKVLSGFLPICAHCKKIRDDDGSWNQIETYIEEHSGALFSHGICPGCTQEFFSAQSGA